MSSRKLHADESKMLRMLLDALANTEYALRYAPTVQKQEARDEARLAVFAFVEQLVSMAYDGN